MLNKKKTNKHGFPLHCKCSLVLRSELRLRNYFTSTSTKMMPSESSHSGIVMPEHVCVLWTFVATDWRTFIYGCDVPVSTYYCAFSGAWKFVSPLEYSRFRPKNDRKHDLSICYQCVADSDSDCLIHSDVLLPAGITTGREIETHADETNNASVRTHLQTIQRGVCYPAASNNLPSFSVIEVWWL